MICAIMLAFFFSIYYNAIVIWRGGMAQLVERCVRNA